MLNHKTEGASATAKPTAAGVYAEEKTLPETAGLPLHTGRRKLFSLASRVSLPVRIGAAIALGAGIYSVPAYMQQQVRKAERVPHLPAYPAVLGPSKGWQLLMNAAEAIHEPAGKYYSASDAKKLGFADPAHLPPLDYGWLMNPVSVGYQAVYGAPGQSSTMYVFNTAPSAEQIHNRHITFSFLQSVLNANQKPLQQIHEALQMQITVNPQQQHNVVLRANALLIDEARYYQAKQEWMKAFDTALQALRLNFMLQQNSSLHQYRALLKMNHAARSVVWSMLAQNQQLYYSHTPQKAFLTRPDLVHMLQAVQLLLSSRPHFSALLQNYRQNHLPLLADAVARYYQPAYLLQSSGLADNEWNRLHADMQVIQHPWQHFIRRYEQALNAYAALTGGAYTDRSYLPLVKWQVWLRQRCPRISEAVLPPVNNDMNHRADLAYNRLLVVTLAEMLYARDHGAMPASLQQLVPAYLPAVPADPFARVKNQPLCYLPPEPGAAPAVGGLAYSIGPADIHIDYFTLDSYGGGTQQTKRQPDETGQLVAMREMP